MNEKGITVKDMSEALDIAPQTINTYIKGESAKPSIPNLYKISQLLGVPIDDLLVPVKNS